MSSWAWASAWSQLPATAAAFELLTRHLHTFTRLFPSHMHFFVSSAAYFESLRAHTLNKCRERNRAAQKRYRDRQRSRLAEREEQLAALTQKLSLVLNEKVRWVQESRGQRQGPRREQASASAQHWSSGRSADGRHGLRGTCPSRPWGRLCRLEACGLPEICLRCTPGNLMLCTSSEQ